MRKKKELPEISRRKFLADAGLLIGGAAIGSSILLSACAGETQTKTLTQTKTQTQTETQTNILTTTRTETLTNYGCPYDSEVFNTKDELAQHIWEAHAWSNSTKNVRHPVPVGITIGCFRPEDENSFHLRIDEIVKRGHVCTCEIEEESSGGPSNAYLKELADAGFELELNFQDIANFTTHEDQLKYISDRKDKLEQATGHPALGGRRPGSRRDEFTYPILEELGMKWYHIRPSYFHFPYQESEPYKCPDYNIALCPRPAFHIWNPVGDVWPHDNEVFTGPDYFWDNLGTTLDGYQWNQAWRDHLDMSIKDGTHQEVRWFSWMDDPVRKSNAGPSWLAGMKESLDYLIEKENAGLCKVMLYEDMLKLYCPEVFD